MPGCTLWDCMTFSHPEGGWQVGDGQPSIKAIEKNAQQLADYASICQVIDCFF